MSASSATTSQLLRRWHDLFTDHDELGCRLVAAWSEPGRVYHDTTHLLSCLDAWAALGGTDRSEALALWFHDVVHQHQPGTDERASADYATSHLALTNASSSEIAQVARLILSTIDHRPSAGDAAAARVCDADLAILGAPVGVYRDSVRRLRAEFAELSASQWRAWRRRQLQEFTQRDSLYSTTTGRELWEAQARVNLATERSELDGYASNGLGSPAP